MTVENFQYGDEDHVRRIILGDELATSDDYEKLENLAALALLGNEERKIHELLYVVDSGYFEMNLIEEDEVDSHVVFIAHGGDTDEPYVSLIYGKDNNFLASDMSQARTPEENVFLASIIMSEVIESDELNEQECSVIKRCSLLAKVLIGIGLDEYNSEQANEHPYIAESGKEIITAKGSGIQFLTESTSRLENGDEITVSHIRHESINGHPELHEEQMYPPLQINLINEQAGLLIYYLRLASGEIICGRDSAKSTHLPEVGNYIEAGSEDDNEITLEAQDIAANAFSAIDKDSVVRLTNAVSSLI